MSSYFWSTKTPEQTTAEKMLYGTINALGPIVMNIGSQVSSEKKEQLEANCKGIVTNVANNIVDKANNTAMLVNDLVNDTLISTTTEIPESYELMDMVSIEKIKSVLRIMYSKDVTFDKKLEIISKVAEETGKKEVRILLLGGTQTGKSATANYVLNLNNKIGNGKNTKSDTNDIKSYSIIQNGIKIIIDDIPGFGDTKDNNSSDEGDVCRDDVFYNKIVDHIGKCNLNEDTTFDVILWIAKIDDVITRFTRETINNLTNDLGKEIWKNTMIILTHCNSVTPPQMYYDMAYETIIQLYGDSLTPKKKRKNAELMAWKSYTNNKMKMWKKAFKLYNKDITVSLIENNIYVNGVCDYGIGKLRDGTLIIETFYNNLFSLIDMLKSPVIITFLAGKIEYIDTITNELVDSTIHIQQDVIMNASVQMNTDEKISIPVGETIPSDQVAINSIPVFNEHQVALNSIVTTIAKLTGKEYNSSTTSPEWYFCNLF
jgi:hypothetical protein